MSCDRVLEYAAGLLDGTLSREERDFVSLHLAECASCRDLVEALAAAPAENPDLLKSILARTTGPTCESARARLCAWTDAELAPFEGELVDGHLAHCADCAALARL